MSRHSLRAAPLVLVASLVALTSAVQALSGFEATAVEPLRPGVYRLSFSAPPGAAVTISASSRPDRIDGAQLAIARQSPVEVTVATAAPRVYFHLTTGGERRVLAERRLPLEGALNFRDLGGYPTADGRHVKWGMVYRSNHLADLTPKDYAYLNTLGLRLVCDLRTDGERMRSPTVWQGPAPEIMPASVMKDTDVVLTPERLRAIAAPPAAGAANPLGDAYERMVTEFPEQYGRVFKRLVDGNVPSVAHCTAGKDRTGVFSAVLLTMLGVPRDVVVDDYMLTGTYMLSPAGISRAKADWQKLTGSSEPVEESLIRGIYTMHPEAITGTFAAIDRHYGSFDAFVHNALKLTDADVAALRMRLLE